ncbi:MAG: MarR family winged helix-turn-helix transcriptional regulator [Dermatophilaceae bacterium]
MTAGTWLTDTEQHAWRAFLRMRRDLDRAIEGQLVSVGLSAADFALLVPLSEAPEHRLRARDLSQDTGWDRSRLSHHIRRMERRGLVTRHSCDTDARGTDIQLTDQGLAAVHAAAPGHVQTVRRSLIDILSERELEILHTISERVSSQLSADRPTEHHLRPRSKRHHRPTPPMTDDTR